MDIDQQIAELNNEEKCYIAPSLIQGIGVFALRDLKAGEKLYCFRPYKTRAACDTNFHNLKIGKSL